MPYKLAMPSKRATAVVALVGLVGSSAPCFAFGAIGCTNLPEHDRAVGTIENGPYSCGMSTEEAERILARDSGRASGQPAAPTTHAPRKHHRRTPPHM